MGFVNNYSPLRYPGGKASIADFFIRMLDDARISSYGTYCEPFAGGAGVALTLLLTGRVANIIINDFDKCIAAFWYSVLKDTDDLVTMIENVVISLEEWKHQRYIYDNVINVDLEKKEDRLSIAFATFFLNRCNRAGILPKAGPIGGHSQKGKYKIDARFIKNKLIDRIRTIARYKQNIQVTHFDAIDFLDQLPKLAKTPNDTFLYLDPPYYRNGEKLYLNSYSHEDHLLLAQKMNSFDFCSWIMTYDDCHEIREIYKQYKDICVVDFPIYYSMQKVRMATEILIRRKS